MKHRSSLLGRSILAVSLLIGFYALALGIAGGLFYLVYAIVVHGHHIPIKLVVVCVFGGSAILWSLLPRFDKFRPPGPPLTRDEHPRLFDEIRSISRATGQSPPDEVFLVGDVNAWVAQRGGVMGFGSRRVMGLGLPLLRTLTLSQFRGVLAHEFGHYYGGDTKIGPWIYQTRSAIGRTVASLNESVLSEPFKLYAKLFLRITHAISRRQEFVADELAARIAGSRALITGLQAVHSAAPAFDAYWRSECVPVLNSGFRPPLAAGFQHFIEADSVAQAMSRHIEEALESGNIDPYDTHPPLKERIAAVKSLPPGDVDATDPPAITLLEDVSALEQRLITGIAGPEAAGKLQPIDWPEVAARVYLPHWTGLVQSNSERLKGITPESLPTWAADMTALEKRFESDAGQNQAVAVVGATLTLLLVARGGRLDTMPGKQISVSLASVEIEPFNLLHALSSGRIAAGAWQQRCVELGLAGADLAMVAR